MEKSFNIIPNANIYEAQGEDAGDALVNFAVKMDGDMGSYFYADDTGNIMCPYDVNDAMTQLIKYAAKNKMTLLEAMSSIEMRGLKLPEAEEVVVKTKQLIEMKIETYLEIVDVSKFTETTQVTRCFDGVDNDDVVCVDFVYDCAEDLPACDVINVCQMQATKENIYFTEQLTKLLACTFGVKSLFC